MNVQELISSNNSDTDNEPESTRPVKKSRPCHPVWSYFSWNANNTNIICNICQQLYSPGTGVSTIKEHFTKNHKTEWEQIEQQLILPHKSTEVYSIKKDPKKIALINAILIRWIICDQQPFSIVENDEFNLLIKMLNPWYKLPSRQTISLKIQEFYEKQHNASNMDVFGRELARLLLDNHGNKLFRRVRCAAHVLNLIVKDGLDVAGSSIKKLKTTFNEAVILDPNNKLMPFNNEEERYEARYAIYTTYETNYAIRSSGISITEPSESETSRGYFRKKYGVSINHDDILKEYLDLPVEEINILDYWKAKSKNSQWIQLACMARNYLVVQTTSVASEQMFSIAKFIISPTRNRIEPEKACASLCLKTCSELKQSILTGLTSLRWTVKMEGYSTF
ncbi:957_t:CDS:2, partial [Racocetra persica]